MPFGPNRLNGGRTEWPSLADPPTLHAAVPNWNPGDTIPLGLTDLTFELA